MPVLVYVSDVLKKNGGAGVDLGYEPKVTAGTLAKPNPRMISVCVIMTI